jgi:hypothetical protein
MAGLRREACLVVEGQRGVLPHDADVVAVLRADLAHRVLHARAEGALEVRELDERDQRVAPEHGELPTGIRSASAMAPPAPFALASAVDCAAGLCRCLGARDVAHHEAEHQRHDDGNRCCSLTHIRAASSKSLHFQSFRA